MTDLAPAARWTARNDSARDALSDFTVDRRILTLIAMALVIGSARAFSAWLLVRLIALVTNLVWFGRISAVSASLAHAARGPWMVLAPTLGGLVIGLMARFGSEKIRGHGIPEAIEAILIGGSRMSPKVALLKPLSSAIAIGTGGPFGAEGPIIMTSGAIGSLFAQCFHLSAAERKTLLVAGAAAGMTAIFGTPVAAVLLAVELLLFEWKPRSLIPVTAAVVVSAAWRPMLFGAGPLFPFAADPTLPWWGCLLCIGVGLVAGVQSGLLTKLLYGMEDLFERLPIHWMWWPMFGGLAVGVGGLIDPRALGVGYDDIAALLGGKVGMSSATGLLLVKAGIWIIALSSGISGGVLAPLLILGGALGAIEGHWLPGDDGFWALLGMAAMMGGTMRAPLTGAMFAVELTGDIHALVPLLAATGAAYAVTVLALRRSILTEKIARRGQHITREYSVDPFELLRVRDVMVTKVDTLPAETPIVDAVAFFAGAAAGHKCYPVIDRAGRVVGMVSRANALRWTIQGDLSGLTLFDIASDASLLVGHPDDVLGRLADAMVEAGLGRVPIVDPQSSRLVGLVARRDLLSIRSRAASSEHDRGTFFRPFARQRPT
jgi:H+/Cl- antiporter ClcA